MADGFVKANSNTRQKRLIIYPINIYITIIIRQRIGDKVMKRLRSDMKQNLNDIPTGQIIAVVKNVDGSFSPLDISLGQAVVLNRVLGYPIDFKPFIVNKKAKLVIKK